jgi:hypothetical protein
VVREKIPTSKAIEKVLEADSRLMFQLALAEELKMTLSQLKESMTDEEMILWNAYFKIKKRNNDKLIEDAKKTARRR